jgi:26S proteasome regulatory subunit N5
LIDGYLTLELISTDPSSYGILKMSIFNAPVENHAAHRSEFQKQLIQHNLRVIQKYYSVITLDRIAELLGVEKSVAETELCEMIFGKIIWARVDRLTGVVNFIAKQNENDILNEWLSDIHKLLGLVDSTCNLINREHEVHGIH